jgi:hypothetical protein
MEGHGGLGIRMAWPTITRLKSLHAMRPESMDYWGDVGVEPLYV